MPDTIQRYLEALRAPFALPETRASFPELADDAPAVLVFSPHPDDECVTGALPLRLRREGVRVVNVAVTLGSNEARREARRAELERACHALRFEQAELAFTQVTPQSRQKDRERWSRLVSEVEALLRSFKPVALVCPHSDDHHPAHIGTHWLVHDAVERLAAKERPVSFMSEFWQAMSEPNLMVETTPEELATLLEALVCHEGEVARNPYHLRLPGWMIDNVRRGSELVRGFGAGELPDFDFCTLYRLVGADGIAAKGQLLPSSARARDLLG